MLERSSPLLLLLASAFALGMGCTAHVEPAGPDGGGDSGAACGGLDRVCCSGERPCVGALICAGAVGEDPSCRAGCLPALCATSEPIPREGVCQVVTGFEDLGVCIVDVGPSACDPSGDEGCTTAHGAPGLCVTDGVVAYCFEQCVLTSTGCDDAHLCVPLADATSGGIEGVCVP